MRRLMFAVVILGLCMLAVPATARAQTYVAPFVAVDFGGDAGKCPGAIGSGLLLTGCDKSRIAYGVGVGSLAHGTIGAEFDLGYAPTFFGTSSNLGSNHVLTYMGNLIVAIPAGPVHPYVTGGLGAMSSSADSVFSVSSFSNTSFAYNVGGGILVFLPAHLGFRIDYRYMSTTGTFPVEGQPLLTTGTSLNFHRVAFAVAIH